MIRYFLNWLNLRSDQISVSIFWKKGSLRKIAYFAKSLTSKINHFRNFQIGFEVTDFAKWTFFEMTHLTKEPFFKAIVTPPTLLKCLIFSGTSLSAIQLDPAYTASNSTPYPYGMDPIWQLSQNKIVFMDSFKMKGSVVLGVFQMCFGLSLAFLNHRYFNDNVRK